MVADTETGHILVVDDNKLNRLKLSRSLTGQGHTVSTAEDGEQALSILRTEQFDVVLLDIIMPVLDGYGVLAAMKEDPVLRSIPVIVISSIDELDSAVRCIEMGAEDYLPNNFNPVFLRARLSASLRRKKLRDLEQAFLKQEVTLRQSEKLATLGRLSAGMAHELNNPSSAVLSGSQQVQLAFEQLLQYSIELSKAGLAADQIAIFTELRALMQEDAANSTRLDSITRSDREYAIETLLEDIGLEDAWEYAPALVDLGIESLHLEKLSQAVIPEHFALVIRWLVAATTISQLIRVMGEGAARISGLVKALKNYSYLDQAPVQNVDVHEGLDNTLLMLNSRIKKGITVHRQYQQNLPLIEAYGSELNQVWTNLIDNAISAMNGEGELTITTSSDDKWICVEIEDNGPGIPPEVLPNVFDPFFTTKPPGEGSGLGLNISHNIIVEKHQGEIMVDSHPGQTCFLVKLPLPRSK